MKRCFIFIVLLAMILAGCKAGPDDQLQTESMPTESPITESATIPVDNDNNVGAAVPMITVSVPTHTENTTADDGTVIFRAVTQNMQLVMPDPDVAERIVVDFLNRIDQTASTANETVNQAKNAYQPSESWIPYLCSITYAPQRVDQTVLSLYGSYIQYNGGAHAVLSSHGANYNVLTGDVLTLGSIITDASSVDKLCTLTIDKLSAVAEEKYLRDGFEETVKSRFSGEESYDEAWYFTTNGLCFYFDQYAIAPYSSGVITAEIPYADLVGIIDDAFFPPELEQSTGTVTISPADNTDVTQFTRFSEVVLDNEAPMYILHTETSVQNLRITLTDADLGHTCTVFATPMLYGTDAIVVQANPSMFHRIDIYYESGGQQVAIPLLEE